MLYKQSDVPYCGVSYDNIQNSNPQIDRNNFGILYYYIQERYKIHVLKDVYGVQPPWTKDPILSKYRFTNIRREHDRETRWLANNICLNSMDVENKIANIILFRMINKSSTCQHFMPLDFGQPINWGPIIAVNNSEHEGALFTNAYMISGMLSGCRKLLQQPNMDALYAVVAVVKQFWDNGKIHHLASIQTNPQEWCEVLRGFGAMGDFLTYQIWVDYTYCPECPWSENEFVVAGPGCKAGLNYIFTDRGGMTYEECLFWLRNNWDSLCKQYGFNWNPNELFIDLPPHDRYMNVMSLENCMCELSKYMKGLNKSGRLRATYVYHGGETHNEN